MIIGARPWEVGQYTAEIFLHQPGYPNHVRITDGPGPMTVDAGITDADCMVVDVPGTGPGTFQQASCSVTGTIKRIVGGSIVDIPVTVDTTVTEKRRATPTSTTLGTMAWVVTERSNGAVLMDRTSRETTVVVQK